MLKMVICDDEQIIRESISSLIDWEKLDIKIVGCCKNGIEALDTIMDEYPDIVITDIKMPGLNGLELIEKIQLIDKNIEFIILSGYKDFEFAKQAMQYGVKHYLLKPISEDQIFQAVDKVKKDCQKYSSISEIIQQKEHFYNQMTSIYKKQFVYEIFSSEKDLDIVLKNYQKYFDESTQKYQIVYFSFLEECFLQEFVQHFYAFIDQNNLHNIIDLLYVTNSAVTVFELKNEDQRIIIKDFAAQLSYRNQSVSLAYQDDVFPSLKICVEHLKSKLTRYQKILLVDRDLSVQEINNYVTFLHKVQTLSKELIILSQNNDLESACKLYDNLFVSINDIDLIHSYGANLVSSLITAIHRTNGDNFSGFFDDIYMETDLKEARNILKQTIINILFTFCKIEDKTIEKAKNYINEHLDDSSLSLKWIAENYLYMNVDYLSRQFINKTGEKFSSYLNRIRMEKAKKLLLKYDETKIYLVAEQIGCGHNPRYFSQIFKKYTGMTPSTYINLSKR